MQVARPGAGAPAAERRTEGEHVTGLSWAEGVLASEHAVSVSHVFFEPASRTDWHTHGGGQVLHVTAGRGWACTRAGEREGIATGDTVFFAPGEEHWHGAQREHYLMHLAVTLGEPDWLEPVTDEDYGATAG